MTLEIVDYRITRLRSKTSQAPNTLNTVTLQPDLPVPIGFKWVINGLNISCSTPGANLSFSMFDQDPAYGPVPANSTVAGFVDADNSGEILVDGGDQLYLVWSNVPHLAICKARIQYQVVRLSGMTYTFGT